MSTDPVITKIKFRMMLVLSLVFIIISTFIDANNETAVWINSILAQKFQAALWENIFVIAFLMLFIITFIGVFLLKEWARKIYIYTFFPSLFVYLVPSLSWVYMSGVAAIFSDLSLVFSSLIWGILVIPSLYQSLFAKI